MKKLVRRYIYLFKRLSWPWRIVLIAATIICGYVAIGVLVGIAFILLPLLFIFGIAGKSKGKKEWHISGQSDKEWAEENDRRALGEDY